MFCHSKGWYMDSVSNAHEFIAERFRDTKKRDSDTAKPHRCICCKHLMQRPGACTGDAGQAYEAMETHFFTRAIDGLFKRAGLNLQGAEPLLSIFDPSKTFTSDTKKHGPIKKMQGDKTISDLSTPVFAALTGRAIGSTDTTRKV